MTIREEMLESIAIFQGRECFWWEHPPSRRGLMQRLSPYVCA